MPSDASTRARSPIVWFLAIAALAIGVRVAYWADARQLSLVQVPTGDAATYVYLSEQLGQDGPLTGGLILSRPTSLAACAGGGPNGAPQMPQKRYCGLFSWPH
jgi:hypothetical protein